MMADLKDLIVNRQELDQQLLAEVLMPYVGIDPDRQEVVPKEGWRNLRPASRVLIVLLARKAMCAMPEVALEDEGMSSKALEEATGVRGGTLRPTLSRLKNKTLVAQDGQRRYYVPTHAVLAARAAIAGGAGNEG